MGIKSYMDENDVLHFQVDGEETFKMEETVDEKNAAIQIRLVGDLSNGIAYSFKDELSALISMDTDIKLLMADLSRIGNICVEALLDVQREIDQHGKGKLTLTGLTAPIMETLNSMGVTELLDIE